MQTENGYEYYKKVRPYNVHFLLLYMCNLVIPFESHPCSVVSSPFPICLSAPLCAVSRLAREGDTQWMTWQLHCQTGACTRASSLHVTDELVIHTLDRCNSCIAWILWSTMTACRPIIAYKASRYGQTLLYTHLTQPLYDVCSHLQGTAKGVVVYVTAGKGLPQSKYLRIVTPFEHEQRACAKVCND